MFWKIVVLYEIYSKKLVTKYFFLQKYAIWL
jgi:hypothetical protein